MMRRIVREEKLPPKNPKYPGNARRLLTLECGHVVERSHMTYGEASCDRCNAERKTNTR